MLLSRAALAMVILGIVAGCRPATPVVAPEAEKDSAATTVDAQPLTPAPAIKPTSTAVAPEQPAPMPATEADSFRDLAARLVEPLEEGGWRISESAALELERLGPDAPARLLPLLGDEKLEVRRGAAFHLLSSFNPESSEQVAAFKRLLSDRDATIRNIGFQAIKELPPAEIAAASAELTPLLDPAHESKPENRAAVARLVGSLGQGGTSFATSLEEAATGDSDQRVRSAAVFAYCQIASSPEAAVPLLQKTLKDKHPAVRLVAAGRLRTLGLKAAAAAGDLGSLLADEDERVRLAASEAILRIGPAAIAPLKAALESKDTNAKKLALACLSSFGPAAKEALPAIEKAQQDADKDIAEAAKALVERLRQ